MAPWIVVLILGQFAFTCLIVAIVFKHSLNQKRLRSEERFRLLERFSTPEELSAFLASDAGAPFVDLFSVDRRRDARSVAVGVVGGVISLSLGGGFLLLSALDAAGRGDRLAIPAILFLAAGAGLLLAVRFSERLLRSWGLLGEPADAAPAGRR